MCEVQNLMFWEWRVGCDENKERDKIRDERVEEDLLRLSKLTHGAGAVIHWTKGGMSRGRRGA